MKLLTSMEISETKDGGYVVQTISYNYHEDGSKEKFVYICESIKDLLELILDHYETSGRYDDHRTYIVDAPGDKNDKFNNCHANVIWPDLAEYPCPDCNCKGICSDEDNA